MTTCQQLGSVDLSESNVEHLAAPEDRGLVKYSLASVIFDKFDACPYCGGKFCG